MIMHYVYLTNDVVTDQSQVDPYKVFNATYAAEFIEAPDQVTFGWSLVDDIWTAPPALPAPTPEEIQGTNKQQASTLLQATDWVELGDVADPTNPPYLSNKAAFTAYRAALRSIAVNPPTTPAVFPAKPDEVWLS
jgi:hypothetical protein